MRDESYKEYFRRSLPHIHPIGATLFVTFRLYGSIPQALLDEYQLKKSWLEQRKFQGQLNTEIEELEFHRYWFRTIEDALHTNYSGPTWLGEENVAAILQESLHHRDNKDYHLEAYCIMPNHVHVVFAPHLNEQDLQAYQTNQGLRFHSGVFTTSKIMESLKGFTARKCNQALGRSGTFWQRESYDHVIRDEEEFHRVVHYVLQNPVKAGLVKEWQEWKWSYRRGTDKDIDNRRD